jgi:protein phosphatase
VKLATGQATDNGRARDNNEDSFLVDADHALFAVADGMGGHLGGEVASATAIEALRAEYAKGTPVADAIAYANHAVIARAVGHDELTGMGTTLTAVAVAGAHQLLVGHVGDSRAYFLRGDTMEMITDDHSLVAELVREGRLTPEQAEAHPQRAIVTRALGVDPEVNVDVYTLDVLAGDRIIICSDGLNTMLRDRDIERIARGQADPQRAAEFLVDAANDAGGEDNITVVVIDVVSVDEPVAGATTVAPAVAVMTPALAADEPAPKPPRPKGSRARTVRGVVIVLLPLLVIVFIAGAALEVYARGSYFVGSAGNEVVVYKGVPGGVLGWDPTVDQRTGIQIDQLSALDQERVRTNSTRGSLATALAYVDNLQNETTTTTTTLFTTTTTTVKRRTTTTTAKKP